MFCDAKSDILLFQTDTTVGLASQDTQKLSYVKSRSEHKQFLKIYSSFHNYPYRVPSHFKNRVRRSKKTTFIVNNRAFRVAKASIDSSLLNSYTWYYSTSANRSGASFDEEFCKSVADIVIEDRDGLYESTPSRLIKLHQSKMEILR